MDPDELPRITHDPAALESFYREHVEAVGRFVARRVDGPVPPGDSSGDGSGPTTMSIAVADGEVGPCRS
jgi:hypothetical protein